jgi:hypothetical protein
VSSLNPRQFSSLDALPPESFLPSARVPILSGGVEIDFQQMIQINAKVQAIEKANGTYVERPGRQDYDYGAEEREQIRQANDAANRLRARQTEDARRISIARENELRRDLWSKITAGQPEPLVSPSETPLQAAHRLMKIPPPIEGQPTSTSPSPSTSERQPLPSRGSPPPTMSGTAARASALVEPTATPAPAALKEAIGGAIGGIGQSLPKALPQSAGRLLIPGVGAGLTLAGALIAGQSIQQALATTAIVTGASVVGGLIGTAVGGPIGGYVGSMVGGFVGGYLANSLLPMVLPSNAARQEFYAPSYAPFIGGQKSGARYNIVFTFDLYQNGVISSTQSSGFNGMWGPIQSIALENPVPENGGVGLVVVDTPPSTSGARNNYSFGFFPTWTARNLRGVTVVNTDGTIEAVSINNPTPPPDKRPAYYSDPPLNTDNAIPSGKPGAGLNKGKNRDVAPSMPSNNVPNGGGAFPGHGGLAPSYLPNPTQVPSNGGAMMPQMQPASQPLPFAEPEDLPQARIIPFGLQITPSTGGISEPGYAQVIPATITPATTGGVTVTPSQGNDSQGNMYPGVPFSTNSTGVPTTLPFPVRLEPVPDALSPTPKVDSFPKVESPTETTARKQADDNDATKKAIEDQIGRLTAIATAIAALTPAINGIPDAIANNPNVRAANRDDVQGAVCEISQPTGCLGAPIKQAEDAAKANGNKLDQINAALGAGNAGANAALLAGQATILERLGDQLPGGIGGKLSRFAEWMHLDRVLNIMILATTLHNGLMLSNDIGQTLLGIINNALTLIGLKKEDGSGFDIGSIISGSIENLIKGAIGTENYQQLSTAWQKANRVYQATTNVLNQLMNVNSVITNALEVIGSYTGKIGNALRIWGVLGEKAYSWMNPQPSFDNKWITKLQQLQQNASTVAMVAQIPVDAVNAVTELNNSATEFVKAVQQEPETKSGVDVGEAAKVKAEREAAKTASYVPVFDISDLFDAND